MATKIAPAPKPFKVVERLDDIDTVQRNGEMRPVLMLEQLKKAPGINFDICTHDPLALDMIVHKRTKKKGYRFACAKVDPNFRTFDDVPAGQFRYKSREVEAALDAITKDFKLARTVNHDSGMGVHLWNIWEK